MQSVARASRPWNHAQDARATTSDASEVDADFILLQNHSFFIYLAAKSRFLYARNPGTIRFQN
jgi:hypothetical protein